MVLVGALQRLTGNSPDGKRETRRAFTCAWGGTDGSRNFAIKDLSGFAHHDRVVGLGRDDRGDDFALRLGNGIELPIPGARSTVLGANPKRAAGVGFERQHPPGRQTFSIDGVRPAAVVTRQSTIGGKPGDTVFGLRNRMCAIRRQAMK